MSDPALRDPGGTGDRPAQAPDRAPAPDPARIGWQPAMLSALNHALARVDGNLGGAGGQTAIELASALPLKLDRVIACAHALLDAGQLDAAEHLFQALATIFPDLRAGALGLAKIAMLRQDWQQAVARWGKVLKHSAADIKPLWVREQATALTALGRPGSAFDLLESHGLIAAMPPSLYIYALHRLLEGSRLADARTIFVAALRRLESAADLAGLVSRVAPLFEGWQRTDFFLTLLRKIDQSAPSASEPEWDSFAAVRLRLLLALRDYAGFLRTFGQVTEPSRLGVHEAGLRAVATRLADPRYPDRARTKVFGIGLSRTGTTSLGAALTQLGLFTLHWSNRLTGEMLSDTDVPLFDAFVDTPACMNFERNYYLYPNAKFIYTVRPRSDWQRSWSAYTRDRWGISSHDEFAEALQRPDQFEFGTQFVELHMALYYNHASDTSALDAYESRVTNFFADKPADRFLRLDLFAGDGWAKLCDFLRCDPPNGPFPWENRGPAPTGTAAQVRG